MKKTLPSRGESSAATLATGVECGSAGDGPKSRTSISAGRGLDLLIFCRQELAK